MDAAVPGDRLLEGTLKCLLRPGSRPLQRWHWGSSKVLAGLAFLNFEMRSQYPQSAFQGSVGVTRDGQQQFATQTLRVHLRGHSLKLQIAGLRRFVRIAWTLRTRFFSANRFARIDLRGIVPIRIANRRAIQGPGSSSGCNARSAPKERRRRRAEKRLSKTVFWRVRFFSAPLRFSGVLRAKP